MVESILETITGLVDSLWPYIAAVVAIPAVSTAILAYVRRPKSAAAPRRGYLSRSELLRPPLRRPAYSDRMAYVLAEMSDLAYCQFESPSFLEEAGATALDIQTPDEMTEFLGGFAANLLGRERALGKDFLRQVLEGKGFALLDVLDIADTQGFVCKRDKGTEPYLVIAFRGTEKKVSDWLTDANCVPRPEDEGSGKVHTGFWKAMAENQDQRTGETIEAKIRRITEEAAQDGPLPLFITGHSLGGALALLATKLVAPDVDGACYTFGAPRVANYEYFSAVKTPVYRVVNSSDIVPRVPPGAGLEGVLLILRGLAWVLSFAPPVVSLLNKLEESLDRLNGYRHFGDLRYLSDVGEGRFEQVRLLTNPPAIDRVTWMWRRIAKSALMPIRSHNMVIYRKKLEEIAGRRNEEDLQEEAGDSVALSAVQ
ncbi:MAG: lipase family protein [Gemmatimonadetes bacterium]|nr:lipase family protein [Gemmatimonadota bacterium]